MTQKNPGNISVLLPVGPDTTTAQLERSVRSLLTQSLTPDEILLITNTQVRSDTESKIANLTAESPEVLRVQDENASGLGGALQVGLETCSGEFVARMDADDISLESRFQKQLDVLLSSNADVVGSHLAEFSESPDEIERVREVPLSHEEIVNRIGRRCPMNHPTVMFRRSAVLGTGGYRHVPNLEDWDLWARCVASGLELRNIDEVLAKAHAGTDLLARRGGVDYAHSEVRMQQQLYQLDLVSFPEAVRNLSLRAPVRIAPLRIREAIYNRFARSSLE